MADNRDEFRKGSKQASQRKTKAKFGPWKCMQGSYHTSEGNQPLLGKRQWAKFLQAGIQPGSSLGFFVTASQGVLSPVLAPGGDCLVCPGLPSGAGQIVSIQMGFGWKIEFSMKI